MRTPKSKVIPCLLFLMYIEKVNVLSLLEVEFQIFSLILLEFVRAIIMLLLYIDSLVVFENTLEDV